MSAREGVEDWGEAVPVAGGGETIWDFFFGRSGTDSIWGQGGDDVVAVEGSGGCGSGGDTIIGSNGKDEPEVGTDDGTISGLGGNDLIDAGSGRDTIDGAGRGQDTIDGGSDDDIVVFDAGFPVMVAGFGEDFDVVTTDDGAFVENVETFRLSGDDDGVFAVEGTQSFELGAGEDAFHGGADGETVRGDGGEDLIEEPGGNDILTGGGDDTMLGGAEVDKIYGDAGDDVIIGGDGADPIYAYSGADDIVFEDGAHAGMDMIHGFG